MTDLRHVTDLQSDGDNANLHQVRGSYMVHESLTTLGAGRGIAADKHGRVIAGNQVTETAQEISMPIRVIATDGSRIVAVRRRDLVLGRDLRARELSIVDNRSNDFILWDKAQIAADAARYDLTRAGFEKDEVLRLVHQHRASLDRRKLEEAIDEQNSEGNTETPDRPPSGKIRLRAPGSVVRRFNARLGQMPGTTDVERVTRLLDLATR